MTYYASISSYARLIMLKSFCQHNLPLHTVYAWSSRLTCIRPQIDPKRSSKNFSTIFRWRSCLKSTSTTWPAAVLKYPCLFLTLVGLLWHMMYNIHCIMNLLARVINFCVYVYVCILCLQEHGLVPRSHPLMRRNDRISWANMFRECHCIGMVYNQTAMLSGTFHQFEKDNFNQRFNYILVIFISLMKITKV